MSALNYDGPRRFSRPTSARTFPETYYNERHVPYDYPRADPYAYPMGGPFSELRNRAHVERDEFQPEQGGARRRIAVAVSLIIPALPANRPLIVTPPNNTSAKPSIKACIAVADFRLSVRVVERGRSAALEIKVMVKVARTAKQQVLRPVNVSFTA